MQTAATVQLSLICVLKTASTSLSDHSGHLSVRRLQPVHSKSSRRKHAIWETRDLSSGTLANDAEYAMLVPNRVANATNVATMILMNIVTDIILRRLSLVLRIAARDAYQPSSAPNRNSPD